MSTLGIGVDIILQNVGIWVQRFKEVNHLHLLGTCHAGNGLLYLLVPVACARFVAPMAVGQGCHPGNEESCLGVYLAEGLDKGTIVTDKLVLIVGPVARVSIVDAKVYYHYISGKGQSVLVLLLLGVGAVSLVQQGSTRLAEVAHLVAVAQHALQLHWIGIHLAVCHTATIGDTIAHACHLDLLLLSICASAAQHNHQQINDSFHSLDV